MLGVSSLEHFLARRLLAAVRQMPNPGRMCGNRSLPGSRSSQLSYRSCWPYRSPRRNEVSPPETEADGRIATDELRIRMGSLLKMDTVSFILGAGASNAMCEPTAWLDSPRHRALLALDSELRRHGSPRFPTVASTLYAAAHRSAVSEDVPSDHAGIYSHGALVFRASPPHRFPVNRFGHPSKTSRAARSVSAVSQVVYGVSSCRE